MLTKFNFNESLDVVRKCIKDDQFDNVFLAYRLAKYALHNRYPDSKFSLNLPLTTLNTLVEIKKHVDFFDIVTSLVYYVKQNSFLLTDADVINDFGMNILSSINLLIDIEKIACSNAVITKSKQKMYFDRFPYNVQILKVNEIISRLRNLDLNIDKTYPLKVYNRYLPILECHKEFGIIIYLELKKVILKLLKKHKDIYSELDIIKLHSIVMKGQQK